MDLNGNTGVAFRDFHKTKYKPKIELVFDDAQPSFKLLWLYRHPLVHARRQLHQLSVTCRSKDKEAKVADFDLENMAEWTQGKGWVKLKLERVCPFATKIWEFRDLRGSGGKASNNIFYVFDVLLGYDSAEQKLLPEPASSKIGGFCVSHQKIDLGNTWQAMSWDQGRWQRLVQFKPDADRIPPSSELSVQLTFDETRVDWSGSRLPGKHGLPSCQASLVVGCSSVQPAGESFHLMDKDFTGISGFPARGITGALYQGAGFSSCPPKDGFSRWVQTPDSCGAAGAATSSKVPLREGPKMISSQHCSSCATRIQFSRLAEFKSGQNVTVLLKSAVEGTLPAGRLPCCKANAYKQTHFKTGYLGACASPYKRCWNGILKSKLDQRPLKDWGRCAVRGALHVTYWYKPGTDEPCMEKKH